MDQFYTIVLAVAVIILIITLTYIGIKMKSSKASQPFPPVANTCPDYWTTTDASGNTCIPQHGVNNPTNITSIPSIKNTESTICGKNGLKQIVNSNSIVWDGVSNYNSC
jgi:hypothetical protein